MQKTWRKQCCRLSLLSAARSFISSTLLVSHAITMQLLYLHHRKSSRRCLFCIAFLVQRFFISKRAGEKRLDPLWPLLCILRYDQASPPKQLSRCPEKLLRSHCWLVGGPEVTGATRLGLPPPPAPGRAPGSLRSPSPPPATAQSRRARAAVATAPQPGSGRAGAAAASSSGARCPWAGGGRWRRWCCCGRGWHGPAAPRWVSSGGPFSAAPRSWRPSPIGALRLGKATVPPSRATAVPRLHLCTGQVSELSVSSCWVFFLQLTCILDQPWTIRWLQPSLSMATGVLDRL